VRLHRTWPTDPFIGALCLTGVIAVALTLSGIAMWLMATKLPSWVISALGLVVTIWNVGRLWQWWRQRRR
jgi:hypothetical protein